MTSSAEAHFLFICPYRHLIVDVRPESGESLYSLCSRALGAEQMDISLLTLPVPGRIELTKLTLIADAGAMNLGARPWGIFGVDRPFFGRAVIAGSNPMKPETLSCPWTAAEFAGWVTWVGNRSEVH